MWLHVPSTCSASAPAEEASTSGSSEPPAESPGLWCTSSGKPSQRPASWPGWKRRPWALPLFGTTSAPSTAARGVASWIASLAALRAKTSRSPESRPGSTGSEAASSSSRSESPTSAKPRSSSGKTSVVQLELCLLSSPSSPSTATPEPSSPFELLTWARPTAVAGSSSWPTAAVSDSRSSARGTTTTGVMHPGTSLTDAMREWATPNAQLHNYLEDPESYAARSARLVEQGTRPLGVNLGQQAQTWQTPRASDGDKGGPNQTLKGKPSLTAQARAEAWPTPAARDSKGANGPKHLAKERGHHDQLPNAVALWSGRLDPETSKAGLESPASRRISSRLNPAFVEWLMGWPPGSSLPVVASPSGGSPSSTPCGPTGSDSSATASSPRKRRRPSPSSGSTSKGNNDEP